MRRYKFTPPLNSERTSFDISPDELKRKIDGQAIISIDVDKFKPINDNHGHAAGDKVLRDIARILKETIRPQDEAYRTGGDEFTVVLAIDNAKMVKDIAYRLQKKLDDSHQHRLQQGLVSATATVGFAIVNLSLIHI